MKISPTKKGLIPALYSELFRGVGMLISQDSTETPKDTKRREQNKINMNVTQGTIKRITLQAFLDHFCIFLRKQVHCYFTFTLLYDRKTSLIFCPEKKYHALHLFNFYPIKGLISLLNCVVCHSI